MGTGQYRSFHTSARGFLCLFITDKIGQHILCGMPYACWDNKPWNTAVPFSPFRQIRGSSHLSFWKKPIGICRQNLQISGRKKPANSRDWEMIPVPCFFKRSRSLEILGCRQVVRHGTLTPASAGSSPAIPAI